MASAVGRTLAEQGNGVVYGGGRVGAMGALADGAPAAGGTVVEVIPQSLVDWEVAHRGLTDRCRCCVSASRPLRAPDGVPVASGWSRR